MVGKKKIDVLNVGDIVTDAFIKLIDEYGRVEDAPDGRRLSLPFSTKIPFDHVEVLDAVGNSSNTAVNFAKLGLNSSFVTNVGDDQAGRDMIAALERKGVDTRFVKVNAGKNSNYHYVLWYGDERTILIKHEKYDYHWPKFHPDELPDWVYFSSISEGALEYHDDLAQWLEDHPQIKLAFQPGTFQLLAGTERLKRIYQRTEIFAVNFEEAQQILNTTTRDIHELFNGLHALGPKIVVITDGPNGSYASDGSSRFKVPIYPDPAAPVERTGCGDAYTSTFVAAIIKGYPLEGALQWAPITPTNVVQHVGAQEGLLDEETLKEWLAKAPDWYKVERI
ncbi:MAG: carbohydrate kinase family protein [Chloroflexi bacterium]|nr:MAG: carbohydrate kinase family protein [Chloroflexota bacterium]